MTHVNTFFLKQTMFPVITDWRYFLWLHLENLHPHHLYEYAIHRTQNCTIHDNQKCICSTCSLHICLWSEWMLDQHLEFQQRNTISHMSNNLRQKQVQSIYWLRSISKHLHNPEFHILVLNLNHHLLLMFFPPPVSHPALPLLSCCGSFLLTFSFWQIYVNPCSLFYFTLSETVEHWPIVNVNDIIQCRVFYYYYYYFLNFYLTELS